MGSIATQSIWFTFDMHRDDHLQTGEVTGA
jgi:hypothetical protein